MAWYDTAADYTAVPFARGAIFGGAQFLNWGLGKLLPRAIYPEEYERMNRESLERGKDIFFPYKTAGNGKGNTATEVLEFGSGLVGGGAVAKSFMKGAGTVATRVLPKASGWLAQHAPQVLKALRVVKRSGPRGNYESAGAELSRARAAWAANPGSAELAAKMEQASAAFEKASKAFPAAEKIYKTAEAGTKASSTWGPRIRSAVDALVKEGKLPIGEKFGSWWASRMPYSLSGVAADALAGGADNLLLGASHAYTEGRHARAQMDADAEHARALRDEFYRSTMNATRQQFTKYEKGMDAGEFLRAARDESARIGKLTDQQIGDMYNPKALEARVAYDRAVRDAVAAGNPVPVLPVRGEPMFSEGQSAAAAMQSAVMGEYRKLGQSLPDAAFQSLKDAYRDDPAGYRKLLEDKVDRVLIPAAFPGVFRNGLAYDASAPWTGDAGLGSAVRTFRQDMLGDPAREEAILRYQTEEAR